MGVHPVKSAVGTLAVWLPDGEGLQDVKGLAYWSPSPRLGRFTVTADSAGDARDVGDALLASERAGGADVAVEADEPEPRGRRLRYRVRREGVDHLADVLLLEGHGRVVRAGWSARADAPEELKATFAEIISRLEVA